MAAGLYPLSLEQGATFTRTFTVKDDGVVRDLTGYAARMQIRREVSSSTALASWSTTSGHLVINASAGEIVLLVPDEETSLLTRETGVYDLELVAPDGTVERLLEGPVTLSKEVTR